MGVEAALGIGALAGGIGLIQQADAAGEQKRREKKLLADAEKKRKMDELDAAALLSLAGSDSALTALRARAPGSQLGDRGNIFAGYLGI